MPTLILLFTNKHKFYNKRSLKIHSPKYRFVFIFVFTTVIDGLHLTSWWPCWRHNTKEYIINSIVGSSRRGWLTLIAISREIDCKPRISEFCTGDSIAHRSLPLGLYTSYFAPVQRKRYSKYTLHSVYDGILVLGTCGRFCSPRDCWLSTIIVTIASGFEFLSQQSMGCPYFLKYQRC